MNTIEYLKHGNPFSYIQRMMSEAQNMSRFARKPSYEEALKQAGERVERQKDISTTVHNDNTWVAGRHGKKKNPELQEHNAEALKRGAAERRIWRQEHPYLAFAGDVLTAAPLAVAAYPFVAGAGEALAGTAAGQAATSGLTWMTNAAKATPWIAKSLPWIDAGLTSYFAAHGLDHAINEGIHDPEDAIMTGLELAPLGRLAKPMWNTGKEVAYNIADRYMFTPHQDSFTRGIGGETGLQDLVESGLVRGNPVGTEVSANMFGKMYRRNRWHFRDIMDATGREGIAQRYFNRTLSEEDFNAIKKAAEPYVKEYNALPEEKNWVVTAENPDPLEGYLNYNDYKSVLSRDKQTLARATSMDDSGQPLAYFYDDGRNPLTAGHDYASSDYGVRINNASGYNPRIFSGHLHYSMPEAVPLRDSNVEVFKKGPLGLTVKLDKETLQPMWKRDLFNMFGRGKTIRTPQVTVEHVANTTPEINKTVINNSQKIPALSQEEINKAFEQARNWHINRISSPSYRSKALRAGFTEEEIPQLRQQLISQIKRLKLLNPKEFLGKNVSARHNFNGKTNAGYWKGLDNKGYLLQGIEFTNPNMSYDDAVSTFVHEFGHGATFGLNGTETSGYMKDLADQFPLINRVVKYNRTLYPEISARRVELAVPGATRTGNVNYYASPTEMQSRGYEFIRDYGINWTKANRAGKLSSTTHKDLVGNRRNSNIFNTIATPKGAINFLKNALGISIPIGIGYDLYNNQSQNEIR